MKTYCQSCGESIEYSIKIPIVCPFCAVSIGGTTVNLNNSTKLNKVERQPTQRIAAVDVEGEDDEYSEPVKISLPRRTNDWVKVEITRQKGEKIGDIISSSKNRSDIVTESVSRGTDMKKEDILQEFQLEAGSRKKGQKVQEVGSSEEND